MKWLLSLACAGLFSITAQAQTDLPWKVIGSGGTIGAQGSNRVLSGTIGQVLIGVGVITDGSSISQGFWLPIQPITDIDEGVDAVSDGQIGNYPNPFSSSTTITIKVPIEGQVSVRVFDLVGNLVRTLRAELSLAGSQEIQFDGLNDAGEPLATGTYLYEVAAESSVGEQFRRVQRMTILR